MKGNLSYFINNYLQTTEVEFSTEDFQDYLKDNGFRLPRDEMEELLLTSDTVFTLDRNRFATRACIFKDAIFSFMPSREEIEKGSFVIGGRGVPYLNPIFTPDTMNIYSNGKKLISKPTQYSMNFLLGAHLLYGDGYNVMNILNDKANVTFKDFSNVYNLPNYVFQTSWAFKDIEGGEDIKYGDRIICTIKEWSTNSIEVKVQKSSSSDFVVSNSLIEREQWYQDFENLMIKEIEIYGPTDSIFTQLTVVVVEGRDKLNHNENCGGITEFLNHTTKISFKNFGVENRIWKSDEEIPFEGIWNGNNGLNELRLRLTETVDDSILTKLIENDIYEERTCKKKSLHSLVWDKMLPKALKALNVGAEACNELFLNIEKRRDIIQKVYNSFEDYTQGDIRKRTIALFANVCVLVSDIVITTDNLHDYPSWDLIILCQLYTHLVRLLNSISAEEISSFLDEGPAMLEGMEETFEEVEINLRQLLDKQNRQSFKLFDV